MSDPRQPPRIGVGAQPSNPIDQTEPTPPPDVQFDQFEPAADATEPASADTSAGDIPPAVTTCAACKQPITDAYFEAGGQVFCPRCRENYQAEQTGGSRIGRLVRAIVFGTLAGLGGTLIWYGVRRLTGYEVGLIAVVVGLMVGGAVRAGSRGRGGVFYQLLAVFITYSAIAANYVPDIYEMLMEESPDDPPAVVASTAPTSQQTLETSSAATAASSDDSSSASSGHAESIGAGRKVVALVVACVIAFAAPVLAGFGNIIGLLIIGFALWEAWKINKRAVVNFTGPYAMAGGTPPPPIPGAGTV